MENLNVIIKKRIMSFYRNSSLLTKLHILGRLNTCPFGKIEKFVPRNGLIVDYGCGFGIFSHILTSLSSLRNVYGFDVSTVKIKEAKNSLAALGDNIIFSNDHQQAQGMLSQAECIVMLDVLSYFSDRERENILLCFYDNLKKGAILIIKDIDRNRSLKYAWLYFQELVIVKLLRITKGDFLNFFNSEYLSCLLERIGFKVSLIDISRNYLYPHVLFICEK